MADGHKGGQTAASGRARAHSLPEGKQGGADDAKHRYVLAAIVPPYLPEGLAALGVCSLGPWGSLGYYGLIVLCYITLADAL